MKKVITYTEEQVQQIVLLLNDVTETGIQNSRKIATIAQILDSGTSGEIMEPEQPKKKEGEA
jgi:hypothetical protein